MTRKIIKKEIANIKKLRQALLARMNIVQNLQATRSLTVRLFDELIKIMPDGVYLTNVERAGDKITLLGYAESNTNISQLMRNIENNRWIQDPELTEIKKSKDTLDKRFKNLVWERLDNRIYSRIYYVIEKCSLNNKVSLPRF